MIGEIVQKLLATGLTPRSINEGASLETRFLEVTGEGDQPPPEEYRRTDDRVRRPPDDRTRPR